MSQKRNYHNYRVGGKFAKKPQSCTPVIVKPKNHLVLVVDSSGSMSGLESSVIRFVNKWIDDNRKNSAQFGQDTFVTLLVYNDTVQVVFSNVNINDVKEYTSYHPSCSTALFEAQEKAIFLLNLVTEDPNTSFVVNHITDGEENMSWGGYGYGRTNWNYDQKISSVVDLMLAKQKLGNWTFTFLVPPGRRDRFVRKYKLEAGNIKEWKTTEEGLQEAEEQTSAGLYSYYEARSIGVSSVRNFYDVKVDLSKVTNLAKEAGLLDLSKKYQRYHIDKEVGIKDYVENVLGRTYRQGMCFYQLTKPETVQPTKDVLVMDKDKNKIYGGVEARRLIGLPDNQYAKVDPYNLGNKNIYIKSTSVNRVLVRGTDILIEK